MSPQSSTPPWEARRATLAYAAPFLVYIACMGGQQWLPGPALAWLAARSLLVLAAIFLFSREALKGRPARPVSSALLGVAVFAIWIAPDVVWPAMRSHWLFDNGVTGHVGASVPDALRTAPAYLLLRIVSSVLLVPVLEELFWRGWMMRWLIRPEFTLVPLGAFTAASFWITAAFFAAEHGSYWDVGLAAGVAYNWWMLRTRNLPDLIIAHAVTNGCLAAYVVLGGHWQYWP